MDSGFVDVDNGIFPRLRRGKAWTDVDMSMTFHLTKKGSWTLSMDTVHGHLSMDKVSTASLVMTVHGHLSMDKVSTVSLGLSEWQRCMDQAAAG